jgi:hypothetical protein
VAPEFRDVGPILTARLRRNFTNTRRLQLDPSIRI